MRRIIAANWKMNASKNMASDWLKNFFAFFYGNSVQQNNNILVIVAVPFPYIGFVSDEMTALYHQLNITRPADKRIFVAAQDVHEKASGAYTGDVSAEMIRDVGGDNAQYVILGHSERRQYHHEACELIKEKAIHAMSHSLTPIICVGESADERASGREQDIIQTQLKQSLPASIDEGDDNEIIIAYEPVWAIGTGKVATPNIAADMHQFIRKELGYIYSSNKACDIPILYGGSMNPDNAASLLNRPHINGGLIGGAGLDWQKLATITELASAE